jgi:hypothetical protein
MQSQKKPQGRQERLAFRQNQRKTNKKAGYYLDQDNKRDKTL